jgi:uroporphyrinogen decarboxylase
MGLTLTSRERVNRMFARQDQDRIPRADSFWDETITRWLGEGLDVAKREDAWGRIFDMLGNDFQGLGWCWPQCFPGPWEVLSEDAETRVVREANGRIGRYWKHKSGTPEHLGFGCDSRAAWFEKYKPALLKNWLQLDPQAWRKSFAEGRAKGKWCHLTGVESFEETRQLMGDEVTLMAMIEDPEWVVDVSRTFTDVMLRNFQAVLDTGVTPDGTWIYGDMAFKTQTMCSPAMYRELIWPDHKRMADWAHARGMKFIYHTDGNINAVLDLYVQAGFDCIQPIEAKAGMDIRNICPKYGRQLATFGNIDVMVLMSNDRALIEDEIRTKFAAAMATKGYAYHSDHSVPPQVTWPTYEFVIECVNKYGQYS